MIEDKRKNDMGLETLINRIKPENYVKFDSEIKTEGDDFRIEREAKKNFIAPILSVVDDYTTVNLRDASIILIEAVGASGKTALSCNLSYKLGCPIVDLGKTNVVAGNSLTGLLTKRLQKRDNFDFTENIEEGRSTLIIDALDEGYMKTNNQGFLDFLDDVISLGSTKNCPIILLGRYNAVDLTAAYFMEKGKSFTTLQIEPFTLQKAKDFIDKASYSNAQEKYLQTYKEARDYILEKIGGFFKDQSSIKNHTSERFIGYAPVLLSIVALFKQKTNYKALLDDLQARNIKSVELIVNIIERILTRDREEKVNPQLVDKLLTNREQKFCDEVHETIYSDSEQCARVLYKVTNTPFPQLDIEDPSFINGYNEHINDWIDEHPFMGKRKITNIVFESYMMALLVVNPKYKDIAYQYMSKHGVSYMFAYIYQCVIGFDNLDLKVLPYIYESLREPNNKNNFYSLSIKCDKETDKELVFDIDFYGSNDTMTNYQGRLTCGKEELLNLGCRLEHAEINTPGDVLLSRQKVELIEPVFVRCKRLIIETEELTLYNSKLHFGMLMIDCEEVVINQKYDQFLQIVGPGAQNKTLNVFSPNRPDYPIGEYWFESDSRLEKLSDEAIIKKYKKLRSIILEFRSHSKHSLAKHHERIDFVIGSNDVGKAVIKAMVDKGIMWKEGHLYLLNLDIMDSELGLSYDGIRNFDFSTKVVEFLEGIKE